MRRDFAERRERPLVALHRDDTARAFGEQRPREPAGAGPDLDHGDAFERARGAGDAAGEIEVEQKVLAERFLRGKLVPPDHVAQRRQAVGRGCAHASAAAGFRCLRASAAASRAASFSAAIRLDGSARPVPAMSKAVPWSGEVRTNGRPSVVLTP